MSKSKRIARNTVILYLRMLFLMLLSLFTSRVVLDTLGVTDYGIYNVVGGFVAMFAIISGTLTSACTRFINYEIGKGEIDRLKIVFSTIVSVQCSIALLLVILSEIIGVWYVNNIMVLPTERVIAANWCFQFSIFNFAMNIITVPYRASIVAHEEMKAFAYVSIFEGIARLVIAVIILYEPFDRLVYYALLLMITQFVVRCAYQYYCRKHYVECSYKFIFDKQLFKEMAKYSMWHIIGNGALVLKTHGVNIILNLFFGPLVNAAKAVASQIENAVLHFADNFMIALNPQITQSYAQGDFKYMFELVFRGSKFSFFIIYMLAFPLILNADYIMRLWLKEVPEHAVVFSQLALIAIMISCMSKTLVTAQNATGHIRNFQILVGGIRLINLPLCYFLLVWNFPAEIVFYVNIFIESLALFAMILILSYNIPAFHAIDFIESVVLKCLLIVLFSSILPLLANSYLPVSFIFFICRSILCIGCTFVAIFYLGCDEQEKQILRKSLYKFKLQISRVITHKSGINKSKKT